MDCSKLHGTLFCTDTHDWGWSCFDVGGVATCVQADVAASNGYELYHHIPDVDCTGADRGLGYCVEEFGWDHSCFNSEEILTCYPDDYGYGRGYEVDDDGVL